MRYNSHPSGPPDCTKSHYSASKFQKFPRGMPLHPPTCSCSMGAQKVAFSNQTASNFYITFSSETFWEGCCHICWFEQIFFASVLFMFELLKREESTFLFSKTHKEAGLQGEMTMENRVWHFLQNCPTCPDLKRWTPSVD